MATIERKAASALPNLILPIVGTDQVVMFRDGVVLGRSTVANILASITDLYAQANGIATLDGSGKVPTAQIPDTVLGAVDYKGAWNATTNSPNLGASAPDKGDYYVVATAGSTSLGGITDWKIGDWAIFNGSAWEKVDNTDAIASVFGRTGAITAQSGDYSSDLISYNNAISGLLATNVKAAIDELKVMASGSADPWSYVTKTADEAGPAFSTTFQDDDHLVIAIPANKVVLVECTMVVDVTSANGIKWTVTGPASPTRVNWWSYYFNATSFASNNGTTYPATMGAITSSNSGMIVSLGLIIDNGANAGNITVRHAQQGSAVQSYTAKKGGFIRKRNLT